MLNKADRLAAGELAELTASLAARFPGKPLLAMSAMSGEGVDAWLACVAEGRPAGQHVVEVDYDTYAAGEAALGWLNAAVALRTRGGVDWRAFVEDLLEAIRRGLVARGAEIAHVKLIIARGGESLRGNLTSNYGPVFVSGNLDPAASPTAMRINARVHIGPDELQAIVEGALREVAGERLESHDHRPAQLSPRPARAHASFCDIDSRPPGMLYYRTARPPHLRLLPPVSPPTELCSARVSRFSHSRSFALPS